MRRIVFVQATGYLPRTINGANVSLHGLCQRLLRQGIEPVVISAPDAPTAHPVESPSLAAPRYEIVRHPDPIEAMREAAARLSPDAIILRAPDPAERVVRMAEALGLKLHVYFETPFFNRSFPAPREAPRLRYAANSPFLARMGAAYFGDPIALAPPVIEPDDYRCQPAGDAILFVNPIAMKGVHIVAAIARRMPHRRFLIVRSWPDHVHTRHVPFDLPNVEWAPSTGDVRALFMRSKILLIPSVWEESSGRVLGEAQVSGIPAVASDRGGLPEAVGPGGVCLALDEPADRWCAEIDAMFEDAAHYAAYSRGAKSHAARPDFLPERAVELFLAFAAS